MFRTLQDLMDAAVVATDGMMGKVRNFFFDDQSWNLRYLVVDLGGWSGRKVVIALSVVDRADFKKKCVFVQLTRDQVRHSPDVDSTRPVNRQQEIALREYYGWPARWLDVPSEFALPALPAGREYPVHGKDDPHLRSVNAVLGYQVCAMTGEIGRLEHFIVDEDTWHISHLDVKTGDWLNCRSLAMSTESVESISWGRHQVNVGPGRTKVALATAR